MIWGWVALGAVVAAIVLMVIIVLGTLARMAPLRRAVADLRPRQQEAERLQEAFARTAQTAQEMQMRAQVTQERIAALKGSQG